MKRRSTIPQALLAEVGDKWENLRAAAGDADIALPDDPRLSDALNRVFIGSEFATRAFILDPGLLDSLVRSRDLKRPYPPGTMARKVVSAISDAPLETDLMRRLRHLRHREMVRIAVRDLAGWAGLEETMNDLSALADACLHHSLELIYRWQCAKWGTPMSPDGARQQMVVLGMGKLGARELNFSSDIDLVLAYPSAGEARGASRATTNEEFFMRLGRQLVKIIGQQTAEGIVFRVDLNLRPFGENGPLVMNFDGMENYFMMQGREWERYAWIKARVAAGDKAAGKRLLDALYPFVYRRYLDYGVFDSLREMKRMIAHEVKRKGIRGNIKIGAGGIREIEFFGQVFQLIRGGVVPDLKERRILNVLKILKREGHIDRITLKELTEAYVFLRHTEHRLQYVSDRQTHNLPTGEMAQLRLAAALGFADWSACKSALDRHRENVHRHFDGLLEKEKSGSQTVGHSPIDPQGLLNDAWLGLARDEAARASMTRAGFKNPERIMHLLGNLRNDARTRALSDAGRARLDRLVPHLLKETAKSEDPDLALTRIIDLLKAVQQRTSYLSLLLENPPVIRHLVKLAHASPFIISYLSRHPVLLDELLDHRTLYVPPEKSELENEIAARISKVPPDDLEFQIEELCIFKQVNMLRVAAADVSGALPLMKVSDRLTWIAEAVLDATLELAWTHMVKRYGTPGSALNGQKLGKGFVVIAYGKLGGIELGYGSDLDLVFLHAGSPGETQGGRRALANAQFFVRLGQRIIHLLTAHTSAGALYPVDMRLRPSGEKGILVSHVDAFREYQLNEAWTWEHQALVKARPICGDPLLAQSFQRIRHRVLTCKRDGSRLRRDVRDMRQRMRGERKKRDAGKFDLKNDRGGIIDIEFLVQYLVLRHAHAHRQLTDWTDIVRLIQTLIEARIFQDRQAHFIKDAYLSFRATVHRRSLQEKQARIPATRYRQLRHNITRLWDEFIEEA